MVAAVALTGGDGRILMTQRPVGKSFAGLWEFPGGKLEPGEAPETALVRELSEELGIIVAAEALVPLTFVSHAYDDFHLVMLMYVCRDWQGTPHGAEGQALCWDTIDALARLPMPPADVPLVAALSGLAQQDVAG